MESLGQFMPFILLIAVFYFILIRPQQRRQKQHQQLVQSVGVGDEIVTIGGLFGRVRSVEDTAIHIEVEDGTVMKFAKHAIARRVEPEVSEPEPDVPEQA